MKMVYYISDLFKPPATTEPKFVEADDPFISEGAIARYCDLLPGSSNVFAAGLDTAHTLGEEFFAEANKIQNERVQDLLDAETVVQKAQDEILKEERIVKNQLDAKVQKLMNVHRFFVKRSCPVKIPYKSQLSHEQHELYLSAFLKYQGRLPKTSLEHQEYQTYLGLQNQVFEEQNSLIEFAQKVSTLRLQDYNDVPPAIDQYMQRYLQHSYSRVVQYPSLYHLEQEIPLRPQNHNDLFAGLVFEHTGHLLSLGTVPYIRLPYPNSKERFPCDDDFIASHPPEEPEKPKAAHKLNLGGQTFLNKTTVSEDPNCEYLAVQHSANVVVTPSAIRTLLDNPGPMFDKEWDIPVTVRSFPVTDANGAVSHHRVVFIDKPIKKKLWTPLEKKALFFKKSGLSAITHFRKHPIFKMKTPVLFHRVHQRVIDDEVPMSSYEPSVPSSNSADSTADAEAPADSKRFISFVSSKDGSIYGGSPVEEPVETAVRSDPVASDNESIFDDPFGMFEVDSIVNEFGVDKDAFPSKRKRDVKKNLRKDKDTKKRKANSSNDNTKVDEGGSEVVKNVTEKPDVIQTDKLLNVKSSTISDTHKTKSPFKRNDNKSIHIKSEFKPKGRCSKVVTNNTAAPDFVLDELLDDQKSLLQSSPAGPNPSMMFKGRRIGEHDNISTERVRLPWDTRLETDWAGHDKPRQPTPCTTVNYHYQLFKFHSNKPTTAISQGLPPINVLVRSHLHGISMENFNRQSKKFTSAAYVLFPKLENQVFFGCEVNTHSDIVQQFAQLLVRPNTYILQARICSTNGEVVLGEERDLAEVVREGHKSHIQFQPATSLTSLYATMNTLQRMPPGQYLLHHHNKSEAFVRLLKAVDEGSKFSGHQSLFDLHNSYGYSHTDIDPTNVVNSRQYVSPPWLAIDTHIPTPFHLKHRKIPATFPMDNPNKKMTKSRKQFIKARAKGKKSIYDTPEKQNQTQESEPDE